MRLLEDQVILSQVQDKLEWRHENKGSYSTKPGRELLENYEIVSFFSDHLFRCSLSSGSSLLSDTLCSRPLRSLPPFPSPSVPVAISVPVAPSSPSISVLSAPPPPPPTKTRRRQQPSHTSPITAIAAASSVAASGSSDDTIQLYNISPSTSSSLSSIPMTSTITSLSFLTTPSLSFPTNLLSTTEDGGKLALTVGGDECFAMVNLVRGRMSCCSRLPKEATIVEFNGFGDRFFMVSDDNVTVHQTEDAKLIQQLKSSKRLLCAAPGESGILFTGGEDQNITAWDTNSGQVAYCIENAHTSRVKGIVARKNGLTDDDPYLVASASSDGGIRVWDVRMAQKENPTPLADVNTKSRLTCLTGSSLKTLKRPQVEKTDSEKEKMQHKKTKMQE
ncbi:hypothetical protein ACFE04_001400 [Oxalis oulophora]